MKSYNIGLFRGAFTGLKDIKVALELKSLRNPVLNKRVISIDIFDSCSDYGKISKLRLHNHSKLHFGVFENKLALIGSHLNEILRSLMI